MSTKRTRLALAVAALFFSLAAALPAVAHDPGGVPEKLGKVHFKVECNAAAQKEIDVAMAYYHSFAWEYYKAPLERALKADPACGMAHWLQALAVLDNPFTWPVPLTPKVMADGQAALESARSAGLKTQRERDYVEALAVFYKDSDKLNHRTRAKALEEAMGQVSARYPEDKEAAILYALILSVNFDPADQTYSNQLRAAKILEPIFVAQPEHPGVAHYLIHSYDYPPIARQGLDAARRYSKIAPDATHAQHMPSHIFTRVGAWRESADSNRVSAQVDGDRTWNSPHAYDYMVYAYLQLGQDRAARAVIDHAMAVPKKVDHFVTAYAYAAMPARYAVERGDWKGAANLPLEPQVDTVSWKKYPQAEAMNAFGRGLGAAAIQDPAAAQAEVKRLQALRDAAAEMKLGYWVEQIDIQAEVVRGVATGAAGKREEGIEILRKAAAREDATQKHAVTPGLLLPAREVLAYALLDWGKSDDALREFEAVLAKEPNRYRAFTGAAQAAAKAGDSTKAAYYSARVLELTAAADTARPEMAQAKRTLGM
jgi:tetratricopeptide (TPR) repeat protein